MDLFGKLFGNTSGGTEDKFDYSDNNHHKVSVDMVGRVMN